MSFNIAGTGSYLPSTVVTNDDLSKIVDTSDEWITQRIGVKERRISVDETAADMAAKAAKEALLSSGIKAAELDYIIAATCSSDDICPTVAGMVQKAIGASCPAFDINSACSGFLFALETAAAFYERGAQKILVIGAERISRITDWTDRSTCVIFGDGAGAAVLTKGDGLLYSKLNTFGGNEVIEIPNRDTDCPFSEKRMKKPYIFMDGQETFKFAVNSITEGINGALGALNLTADDISHFVLHQANMRIISYAAKRLHTDINKFFVNIQKYGNTSSASVPIALDELVRTKDIKSGDLLLLSAFGGGLSSAVSVIKWQ